MLCLVLQFIEMTYVTIRRMLWHFWMGAIYSYAWKSETHKELLNKHFLYFWGWLMQLLYNKYFSQITTPCTCLCHKKRVDDKKKDWYQNVSKQEILEVIAWQKHNYRSSFLMLRHCLKPVDYLDGNFNQVFPMIEFWQ